MTKKRNFSKWERTDNSNEIKFLNLLMQISESWMYVGKKVYDVQIIDNPTPIGIVKHLAIAKVERDGFKKFSEPNFTEKIWIRDSLLKGEPRDILEIFPREKFLVDVCDLYHLWALPVGFKIPFEVTYPEKDSQTTIENREFIYGKKEELTQYGKFTILAIYAKNGERISWKEKQKIKDSLIGEDVTAIEMIEKSTMRMRDYESYIIGLPDEMQLPFGLSEGTERRC